VWGDWCGVVWGGDGVGVTGSRVLFCGVARRERDGAPVPTNSQTERSRADGEVDAQGLNAPTCCFSRACLTCAASAVKAAASSPVGALAGAAAADAPAAPFAPVAGFFAAGLELKMSSISSFTRLPFCCSCAALGFSGAGAAFFSFVVALWLASGCFAFAIVITVWMSLC